MKRNQPEGIDLPEPPVANRLPVSEAINDATEAIIRRAGFNQPGNKNYMSDLQIRSQGIYVPENTLEFLSRECSTGVRKLLRGMGEIGLGPQNPYGLTIRATNFGVRISGQDEESLVRGLTKLMADTPENAQWSSDSHVGRVETRTTTVRQK